MTVLLDSLSKRGLAWNQSGHLGSICWLEGGYGQMFGGANFFAVSALRMGLMGFLGFSFTSMVLIFE